MNDFLALTSAFSGLQLIVIVFVLMKLQHFDAQYKDVKQTLDAQGKRTQALSNKLSHVMGRLNIQTGDDE